MRCLALLPPADPLPARDHLQNKVSGEFIVPISDVKTNNQQGLTSGSWTMHVHFETHVELQTFHCSQGYNAVSALQKLLDDEHKDICASCEGRSTTKGKLDHSCNTEGSATYKPCKTVIPHGALWILSGLYTGPRRHWVTGWNRYVHNISYRKKDSHCHHHNTANQQYQTGMNARNSWPTILLLLQKSKAPSWYIHDTGMGTGCFVDVKPICLHIHFLHLGVEVWYMQTNTSTHVLKAFLKLKCLCSCDQVTLIQWGEKHGMAMWLQTVTFPWLSKLLCVHWAVATCYTHPFNSTLMQNRTFCLKSLWR